jgi:hypothetical protein
MITTCGEWMDRDTRFKSWGKVIANSSDVALDKDGGYSLKGSWANWTESVSLPVDTFLVVAAEKGSRKNCHYSYVLVEGGESSCRLVEAEEISTVIEAAVNAEKVTEEQVAKSRNSKLYKYALYCHLRFSGVACAAPVGATVVDEPPEDVRTAATIQQEIDECEERLAELRRELQNRLYPQTG